MRRSVRLSALLAALLIVVAAAFFRRLTRHPVDLDYLLPRLQAALDSDPAGAMLRVGGLELAWDAVQHRPEVRAVNVEIGGVGIGIQLRVPAIALHPRLRPLLRGKLEVGAVDIIEPQIQVTRRSSGDLELASSDSHAANLGDVAQRRRWLSTILGKPEDLPAVARLDRMTIRRGVVIFTDEPSGQDYRAEGVDFMLWRKGEDLAGQLQFAIDVGQHRAQACAALSYQRRANLVAVNVDCREFFPPVFGGLATWLQNLQMPVDLHADLATNDLLQPLSLHVEAHGTAGQLLLPHAERPMAAEGLSLRADLDPQTGRFDVANLSLTLDGAAVEAHGAVESGREVQTFTAELRVAQVPTKTVIRDWPPNTAKKAREWVSENISGGTLYDAGLRFGGHLPTPTSAFVLDNLEGRFSFTGLTVRFLDDVPEVREIEGAATFSPTTLQFAVSHGRLLELDVSRGDVAIGGLGDKETIAVDASADGPLAAALTVLDAPRFGIASAMSIPPADAVGSVSATVKLGFALGKPPTLGDLGLAVDAAIRDAATPAKIGGFDVNGANLDVALNGLSLRVEGDLKVQDIPAHLAATQLIDRPASRRIELEASVDRRARAALGVDLGSWLDGPVAAKLRSGPSAKDGDEWDLDIDLRDSTVSILAPALSKPASLPGNAQARLRIFGGRLAAIEHFEINAGRTAISGSATPSGEARIWQTVDATATIDGPATTDTPGRLMVTLRPGERRAQFRVTSEDSGRVLHALEVADANGGRLTFAGDIDLQEAGLPFDGHLQLDDFAVTRAPTLARLLSLASLSGFLASFSAGGLPFDTLSAKLSYRAPLLAVTDFVMRGKTLLLSGNGNVNPGPGDVEARGMLIPSYYGLNQGGSKLPLIGSFVDRATGGAIQAFDFKLKGPLRDPEVKIEASSLVPGALRDLLRPAER